MEPEMTKREEANAEGTPSSWFSYMGAPIIFRHPR